MLFSFWSWCGNAGKANRHNLKQHECHFATTFLLLCSCHYAPATTFWLLRSCYRALATTFLLLHSCCYVLATTFLLLRSCCPRLMHDHCSSMLCSVGALDDMKEDPVLGILDSRLGCWHPRHSACTTTCQVGFARRGQHAE